MRPMVLMLPVPAMPDHQRREQQRRDDGFDQAQEDRPQQAQFLRGPGKDRAERDARDQRDQNPGGQRRVFAFTGSPHFNFSRSTSKNIMSGGWTRLIAVLRAAADHAVAAIQQLADLAVDGQIGGADRRCD